MLTNTKKNNIPALKAGIDIGSNSIRMLIATVLDGKIVDMLRSERATTRLASGINETGLLNAENLEKSLVVLANFKSIIDEYDVKDVKAYATSAVREARNGADFIARSKSLGIDVKVITGVEEAHLVYLGVSAGLDVGDFPIIFDTGGGSTEIIAAKKGEVILAESYKIGVVKIVDKFNLNNDKADIEGCIAYVRDFFKPIKIPHGAMKLIATAGTATTLAAIDKGMQVYNWKEINGHILKFEKILELFDMIVKTPLRQRTSIIGMDKGREDLIIAGMAIMLEMMRLTGFNEVTIADFGLREGALIH